MRTAALILLLALTACSKAEEKSGATDKPAAAAAEAGGGEDVGVRCALAGAKDYAPTCTREIGKGPDGEIWIIRHPDGGFRRFVLIDNGTRIATADGAEEVKAQRVGSDLEVRVGRDRYLFPVAPEVPVPAPNATAT